MVALIPVKSQFIPFFAENKTLKPNSLAHTMDRYCHAVIDAVHSAPLSLLNGWVGHWKYFNAIKNIHCVLFFNLRNIVITVTNIFIVSLIIYD